jgi:uncharacterized protein
VLEIFHFRDGDYEVDFVLESPGKIIVGIEVKSSRRVIPDNLKGLKHLRKIPRDRFKRRIVLHQGDHTESLGDDLWAIPTQALWEPRL